MARSKRTTRVVNYTESPVSSPAPPSAAAATTNHNNHGKKKKKQQTLQQWTGGVKSSKSNETENNNVEGGQLKRHSNGKFVHMYHWTLFFTTCTL